MFYFSPVYVVCTDIPMESLICIKMIKCSRFQKSMGYFNNELPFSARWFKNADITQVRIAIVTDFVKHETNNHWRRKYVTMETAIAANAI